MSSGLVGQLIAFATAAVGAGWIGSFLTLRAQKRKILSQAGKTDADALAVIQKSALELVAEFESDAKEARTELRVMRADFRKLEQQLAEAVKNGEAANRNAEEAVKVGAEAVDELRRVKAAILDPKATLGGLRDLVTGSSRNGTP